MPKPPMESEATLLLDLSETAFTGNGRESVVIAQFGRWMAWVDSQKELHKRLPEFTARLTQSAEALRAAITRATTGE